VKLVSNLPNIAQLVERLTVEVKQRGYQAVTGSIPVVRILFSLL